MGVCCCLQICNSVVNMVVKGLVLGDSLMVKSTLLLSFLIIYYEVCFCLHVNCLRTRECTLGHQSLRVCEVSYTYLLGCLR